MILTFFNGLRSRYSDLAQFEKYEYRKTLLFFGAMLTCLALLIYKALIDELHYLIVVSAISAIAYLYASYLTIQTNIKFAFIVITAANIVVTSFFTAAYGTDSGFHMLIWPIACIFAMNARIDIKTALVVFIIAILTFAALHFLVPKTTDSVLFINSELFFIGVSGSLILLELTAIRHSISNKRKKLEKIINRDNLTGLHNRRYFTSFLHHQLKLALREGRKFSLAMADIDHFKSINDQYGHDAGDKVLKAVANCFNEYLGKNDVACRWGGEEFLIYLPEENLKLAKRIIQAIGSVLKDTDIDGHFVTMSFGLVESDGSDTIDSLLHKADTLLYQAKAQGRDNVQTRQKST